MNRICDIQKVDEEQRLVYGTVLVPDVADTQGDIVSKEDIVTSAHNFMLEYQQMGEVHKSINEMCKIVESYIEPITGIWKIAVKVFDDAVWDKVKSGEYAAFSVGGQGRREPIDEE